MYYELYIDLFFLENFMMDSLLLLSVNRILNCGQKYGRMILGGALGSVLTCLTVAIPLPAVIKLVFYHVFINSLMLTAGLGLKKLGTFVKAYVLLYISALFAGGIMSALRPYIRTASIFFAVAAVSWLIFQKLWRLLIRMTTDRQRLIDVTLYTDGREIQVKALQDTGNMLEDPVSAAPVSILDPALFQKMPDQKLIRYIPYRCIGTEGVMLVFRIERMCIHADDDRWVESPLLGVSQVKLTENEEYQLILNPDTLKQ